MCFLLANKLERLSFFTSNSHTKKEKAKQQRTINTRCEIVLPCFFFAFQTNTKMQTITKTKQNKKKPKKKNLLNIFFFFFPLSPHYFPKIGVYLTLFHCDNSSIVSLG